MKRQQWSVRWGADSYSRCLFSSAEGQRVTGSYGAWFLHHRFDPPAALCLEQYLIPEEEKMLSQRPSVRNDEFIIARRWLESRDAPFLGWRNKKKKKKRKKMQWLQLGSNVGPWFIMKVITVFSSCCKLNMKQLEAELQHRLLFTNHTSLCLSLNTKWRSLAP